MNTKNELICVENTKSINLENAPYIFVTEFTETAVTNFYKDFLRLSNKEDVKIIPIVVSSYGGGVHSLMCMIDIIAYSKKPVATIGIGKAMSCGAVLLAAGTKGHRYSAPNTHIMIHEVSTFEYGKVSEVESSFKEAKKLNRTLFSLLSEYANPKGKIKIEKLSKQKGALDWFLTSAEFKNLGFVDHVSVPALVKG